MTQQEVRTLISGLGLALLATTCLAMPPLEGPAGGNPPPMMNRSREPEPPFLRGIALSEEQRDKIFDIMHAQAPNLHAIDKEFRRAHDELSRLAMANEFDESKAKALANASAKAMSEIALIHARIDHKIFRMLTPEQRKQIESRGRRPREDCGESRMR